MSELVALGAVAGASAVIGGVAAVWRCVRAAVKAEEAVQDVPAIRKELIEHREEDRQHFDRIERALTRIESRLDVVQNDVGWLRDEARRGRRTG